KKCAVLTDGDLKPSDAGSEEEGEFPHIEELKEYENNFVQIFHCVTTFERAIAIPDNLLVFSKSAMELGAPHVSKDLKDCYDGRADLTSDKKNQARDKVLSTANRFGKARFAQVTSKYVEDAGGLPSYIKEAVEWVME
ncbi:ATP-dependent endonuclease, partial [Planctomycetota bacterium]